jgi:cytochrome c oxidase subunit 2
LQEWLDSETKGIEQYEPAIAGEKFIYKLKGCIGCHTVDDSIRVGPSFKGLFGSERTFTDGTTAVADENYIRESILQPDVKIVAGYPPLMVPQALTDQEIDVFIAYLKTLAN